MERHWEVSPTVWLQGHHWALVFAEPVCCRWWWGVLLGTASWSMHARVLTSCVCVCVSECTYTWEPHLQIEPTMDPAFSFPWPDWQWCPPWSCWRLSEQKGEHLGLPQPEWRGAFQMQNVSHLVQLAAGSWNANRFTWEFQGSYSRNWMLVFCQVPLGTVKGHTAPFAVPTLAGRAGQQGKASSCPCSVIPARSQAQGLLCWLPFFQTTHRHASGESVCQGPFPSGNFNSNTQSLGGGEGKESVVCRAALAGLRARAWSLVILLTRHFLCVSILRLFKSKRRISPLYKK